jgi:hypothetical protein
MAQTPQEIERSTAIWAEFPIALYTVSQLHSEAERQAGDEAATAGDIPSRSREEAA